MLAYLKGIVAVKDPARIVLDVHGVGYEVRVSLNTWQQCPNVGLEAMLVTHVQFSQENGQSIVGFQSEDEKRLFLDLTSVSGVGSATALGMLSSHNPADLRQIIITGNVKGLQALKGIGAKTAERIILELKDRLRKNMTQAGIVVSAGVAGNYTAEPGAYDEALAALMTLGVPRATAEKNLEAVIKRDGPEQKVEDLIKKALRS